MKIKVKKTDVFVPKWNGNEQESDQIKVHYTFLTAGERSEYVGLEPAKIKDGEVEISVKQDNSGMAKKMISRIDGFVMETPTGDVLIDDSKKLYGTAGVPAELISEIEGALAAASAVVDVAPLD